MKPSNDDRSEALGWQERRGLAAVGLTEAELREWRQVAQMLSTLMEGLSDPWPAIGGILTRLLDAVDTLTTEGPRPLAATAGAGAAPGDVTDACLRAIGLVSGCGDELKMAFASALLQQLAVDLAGRAERTPRELMIQMAHRALGVDAVGPGEMVTRSNSKG